MLPFFINYDFYTNNTDISLTVFNPRIIVKSFFKVSFVSYTFLLKTISIQSF